MTIIASVKVRDGLILGTDSMTQISMQTEQGPQLLKSYSNARKLFQIRDRRIGVMTYGLGNLGQRSIEGVVLDFNDTAEAQRPTIQQVAHGLFDFVKPHYEQVFEGVPDEQRHLLGVFVAGYSDGLVFPEEYEFVLPRDAAPFAVRPATEFGANWRGVDAPFTRLFKGFDPYVIPPRLLGKGMSQQDVDEVLAAQGLETGILIDPMPVQDAVNFAVYILETTIGWATFAVGAPSCGGPLQVSTILADRGFAWVLRPEPAVESRPVWA